jgi:three-Cys-motif partner protein
VSHYAKTLTAIAATIEIQSSLDEDFEEIEKHMKVQSSQVARMDAVWGDHSWHQVAYRKTPGLFGDMDEKTTNEEIRDAFRDRLKKVAEFEYVPEQMPMRNSKGSVIYYLFFASPNRTGAKIVKNIFDNYRNKGITSWQ